MSHKAIGQERPQPLLDYATLHGTAYPSLRSKEQAQAKPASSATTVNERAAYGECKNQWTKAIGKNREPEQAQGECMPIANRGKAGDTKAGASIRCPEARREKARR